MFAEFQSTIFISPEICRMGISTDSHRSPLLVFWISSSIQSGIFPEKGFRCVFRLPYSAVIPVRNQKAWLNRRIRYFSIPYDDWGIRIINQALEVLARAAQGILDLFSRHCRCHEICHCPHQVQFIIRKGGPVAGPKRERPEVRPW